MPALNQRHKEIQFLGVNLYFLFSLGAIIVILIVLASSPSLTFTILMLFFLIISATMAVTSLRYNQRLFLIGFMILCRLKDQPRMPHWYCGSRTDHNAL
ncbi:hypothetical protein [Ferrimonas balearica]|uniref:hypothetical protein n=1 Tax=Ferrimonas balearica TaxID=44012 RepID=UPI001C98C2C4|nr:hypothetical protein [Ferrimonas balearica]MBY5979221.1 hypothetical protein [Ferrimonas balearica]